MQLRVAADQRRAEAERFQPSRRARRGKRLAQPMDQDAAGLAPQRDITQRLVREGVPREPIRQRPDQDLARSGQRLQPLRCVHRVAGHRIGFGGADAQSAGNDGARY